MLRRQHPFSQAGSYLLVGFPTTLFYKVLSTSECSPHFPRNCGATGHSVIQGLLEKITETALRQSFPISILH